ncbi:putative thiamine transport system ATP-binding protein [Halomonas shengliensis]|uniref:Putative thiamine transport system ATP-binding protein n=1 Tax=Halomonas shengliensis TaxID=419597 RepID=A0A1H0D3Q0_9GAMM|nr:ATP-binding cassette domain-containing protein [Halomonas shengliensis]SDN64738.1 putative thiamine transport system ATP-binding protein [Halomonas shengliensis]
MNTPTVLRLEQVRIALAGRLLVEVDAEIGPGEVLTLMGPSGVGKSTLLAFIAGFLDPAFAAGGRVSLAGRELTTLPAEARRVGLLFQDPLLFPHLSVAGNLRFGMPRREADKRARIDQALAEVGLAGFGERDPATLSGGQQARVALLRLLLSRPAAALLDEPFSRLDRALRGETRRLVFARLAEAGLPCLLVTHDHEDAEAAGGPVIILE